MFKMLLYFFYLMSISIIVGLTSANPVEIISQSPNDIIDYSTDIVMRETPFPLLQIMTDLTGYQKSALSNVVNIIYWLFSNFFYIITAAVVSFCRLSNLCLGLEEYLPLTRAMTLTREYLDAPRSP